ncbi:hypothetical protein ACLRGF_01260 [Mycetocola zhadangensis]|uniref:hypothetical protein n=1 Tax=Mycetocola zhadangensis TaxID=1164595 RepID=UPI003A4E477B
MTHSSVRSVTGSLPSVLLVAMLSAAMLAGCSAQPAASGGEETAAPAQAESDLTADGLLKELADIECAAYESGVHNQNEIWGEYSTVAGTYEESGLIDDTEVEVPGAGGTIKTISLRTVLTSEDELRDYAEVGEGVTTVRDEVGQEDYDLQTSLFCTVFSNGGVIPDDYAAANGLIR